MPKNNRSQLMLIALALASALALPLLSPASLTLGSASAVLGPRRELAPAPFDVVTRFRPSRFGFAYVNLRTETSGGDCGGMAYAALDYYRANRAPSALAPDAFVLSRDVTSLAANGLAFLSWTLRPDRSTPLTESPGALSRRRELPRLAEALRDGPVPLGLIRVHRLRDVGYNHQVVAYGLSRRGPIVRIRLYDPNHPGADDIVLQLDVRERDAPMREYRAGTSLASWRGFFIERYSPIWPPPK